MKKRIFLIFAANASSAKGDTILMKNLYFPLVDLGHEVFFLNYNDLVKKSANRNIEEISENIKTIFFNEHKKNAFDFFFYYLHALEITSSAVNEISKSVFTINYTTNFHQFDMYREQIKCSSLNLFATKIAEKEMSQITSDYYWIPFAANPKYYCISNDKKIDKISLIGTCYGPRAYYAWRILQNNIALNIYGPRWEVSVPKHIGRGAYALLLSLGKNDKAIDQTYRFLNEQILLKILSSYKSSIKGALTDEEYFDNIATSQAVINFPESRYNHDYNNPQVLICTNLRDFEVTMCGTLLITQRSEELKEFFKEDDEVIAFSNEFELVDKIKYYAQNPEAAKKIAMNGYLRAQKEHTWQERFKRLFDFINQKYGV